MVECRSILLIGTPSTPIYISVDSRSRVNLCSIVSYELIDTQLDIKQLLIKCQSSINRDVHRVSIKMLNEGINRPQIPLVHNVY